jgi:redox-sensitive bicupin YhaK (pirin superfamily)
MRLIRRSAERGHFDHGWLDTFHTFSFGDYQDPEHMQFRSLRVMNEDRVAPGQGFGMHGHRDMEIVTCVLSGKLEHRDSLGHGEVLGPGELQRMSAGKGIRHSEFNPSSDEPVHLYQIRLLPERIGIAPEYEQKRFDWAATPDRLHLVAARDARDGALGIHQDAAIYLAAQTKGVRLSHPLDLHRHAWLQVLRGSIDADGAKLSAGDGLAVGDEPEIAWRAIEPAEVMLFDLN